MYVLFLFVFCLRLLYLCKCFQDNIFQTKKLIIMNQQTFNRLLQLGVTSIVAPF